MDTELEEVIGPIGGSLDLSPTGICIHRHGRILYANPVLRALVGADEMVGGPVMDYVHPDDRPATQQRIRSVIAVGQSPVSAARLLCKNGSFVNVETVGVRLDPETILVFVMDVTERKKHEAERERLLAEVEAIHAS